MNLNLKTKNMKILSTDLYLLLIDEEAEININDYITDKYNVWKWKDDSSLLGRKKVLAYYPLSKEAKELDLLLLPPFENDNGLEKSLNKYIKDLHSQEECIGFIDGYKASQSKGQYSLEDMKKAIEMARGRAIIDNENKFYTEEEIIQSLSAQRLPSEFIPEWEKETIGEVSGTLYVDKKLKTITNSEGKEEIQGTYKY